MSETFNKDDIESITLQSIFLRPYQEMNGIRVYPLEKESEEVVIKNMEGCQEVNDLTSLSEALADPDVKKVYIPKFASITSKGMKGVLARASLTKNIYCAFKVVL